MGQLSLPCGLELVADEALTWATKEIKSDVTRPGMASERGEGPLAARDGDDRLPVGVGVKGYIYLEALYDRRDGLRAVVPARLWDVC